MLESTFLYPTEYLSTKRLRPTSYSGREIDVLYFVLDQDPGSKCSATCRAILYLGL
jgi:hypothetical protein